MDITNGLEKAFFKDMLANGIPVNEDFSLVKIFENLQDAAASIGDFDVVAVFEEDKLLITDKFTAPIVALRIERNEKQSKILFYAGSQDEAMEHARVIGQLVFLLVTMCSSLNFLDIVPKSKAEESFDFESDFV